jgi:hypothetical protein
LDVQLERPSGHATAAAASSVDDARADAESFWAASIDAAHTRPPAKLLIHGQLSNSSSCSCIVAFEMAARLQALADGWMAPLESLALARMLRVSREMADGLTLITDVPLMEASIDSLAATLLLYLHCCRQEPVTPQRITLCDGGRPEARGLGRAVCRMRARPLPCEPLAPPGSTIPSR